MKVRKTEEKLVKKVEEVESYIVCDWCGRDNKKLRRGWSSDSFAEDEITIERRKGETYSNCGGGEEVIIDLCPDCFEKVLDWLKSQGVKVECKEWSW